MMVTSIVQQQYNQSPTFGELGWDSCERKALAYASLSLDFKRQGENGNDKICGMPTE